MFNRDAIVALYNINLHDLRWQERQHKMKEPKEARIRAERNSAQVKL